MSADFIESESPTTQPSGEGEENPEHTERQPGLGSQIRFQVWLRRDLLGPAWAVLCGAVASRGLTLSVEPLLQVALLVFLVDVIWGGLWSGLAATDWATPLHQWQRWRQGSPSRFLPYTSPDGPAGRIALTWGQLRNWWEESARPILGPTLAGLGLLLPLAVVVAAVLGVRTLLITLAAVTLLQFAFAWTGGDARPLPGPQALFEITLPWLAGYALFAALTPASTLLALGYGLSYAGGLRMVQNRPGLARWNLGQLLAVVTMVALQQPLMAGIVGLILMFQALVEPGLIDEETEQVIPDAAARFVRSMQPWFMAGMFVAAWGVRAAGVGG